MQGLNHDGLSSDLSARIAAHFAPRCFFDSPEFCRNRARLARHDGDACRLTLSFLPPHYASPAEANRHFRAETPQ
jgi:hypothetical protein